MTKLSLYVANEGSIIQINTDELYNKYSEIIAKRAYEFCFIAANDEIDAFEIALLYDEGFLEYGNINIENFGNIAAVHR